MKTDTPRTDAKAQFFGFNPDEGEEFVQADFARELERENAALRVTLKAESDAVTHQGNTINLLRDENAELKADNAMLRQMLDLTLRIPDMSDSELKELIQNCKAVNDSARKEQP